MIFFFFGTEVGEETIQIKEPVYLLWSKGYLFPFAPLILSAINKKKKIGFLSEWFFFFFFENHWNEE